MCPKCNGFAEEFPILQPYQLYNLVLQIEQVIADIANDRGIVEAYLAYIVHPREGKKRLFEGKCTIHFVYENDDWSISAFELPGFGD